MLTGRLTVVLAAAGYGKTTAVRSWLGDAEHTWLGPSTWDDQASTAPVVVIDDLHLAAELPALRPPPTARLVLLTRQPPTPGILRWAGGVPVEVGPGRLALSRQRTIRLLHQRHGIAEPEATHVHQLTAGWPALVLLAGAALAGSRVGPDQLAMPGNPIAEYVDTEVLAPLSTVARRLVADCARIEAVSPAMARELGHRDAERTLAWLARLGLVVPTTPDHQWYRLVPLLAAVVRAQYPARPRVLRAAADWHVRHGRSAEALRLHLAAEDPDSCAALLSGSGSALLAGGAAVDVAAAIRSLPAGHRDERLTLLLGEALAITGDTAAAVDTYATLDDGSEELPAGLAWRYGAALYYAGTAGDALVILRRGRLTGADSADEAQLLAWTAAAHWLAGDATASRAAAHRAHRTAEATGDPRARSAAYVALALVANLDGDQAALHNHYERALALAEAAGDVVQAIRIRTNLAVALEREARYADALAVLTPAVTAADRIGHTAILALGLGNQASLLSQLGRLDEAVATYERCVAAYQKIGSRKVSYPLSGLGILYRLRGRTSQALAAFEEAARIAAEDENRLGLIPALAGLARTLAAEDPDRAAGHAARALELATGPLLCPAQLAHGWVALAAGDVATAVDWAQSAAAAARAHRDAGGLAEALELRGAASTDPREARQAYCEALAIHRDAGAEVYADLVRVALGRLPGAAADEQSQARLATGRLTELHVVVPDADGPVVQIQVMGQFRVLVDGEPVPAASWQSRKARDLLRILITRRGRPTSREELTELLWEPTPDEADKVGHRLAALLSILRGVLDPGRRAATDHFITADASNLALNLDRLVIDVEAFLDDARHGLRLHARGASDQAGPLLRAAEAGYAEVFAGDPYDTWLHALREEARAVYLHVTRVLAELSRRAGDCDDAVRYLLRILSHDPYDEQSHRDLVTVHLDAGRYGEARRGYDRYAAAMAELGLPAPTASARWGAVLARDSIVAVSGHGPTE
ncbi:hypothetical protein CS0771_31630 [Catellatospora sp. IY07-71]|uniref:tetratricopeptide repeat protein n=1 Tax=Catellatospora sp. IY07-71 TaxID=2728827 RepID=UPI001BB31DEF|nr:tetratricopeptide repeat protein [Catellatospora sp. IY07-71]BCJ73619.1 hypothetical protein CS0771_31630 [Catellatospora sp. IY07-71]